MYAFRWSKNWIKVVCLEELWALECLECLRALKALRAFKVQTVGGKESECEWKSISTSAQQ